MDPIICVFDTGKGSYGTRACRLGHSVLDSNEQPDMLYIRRIFNIK